MSHTHQISIHLSQELSVSPYLAQGQIGLDLTVRSTFVHDQLASAGRSDHEGKSELLGCLRTALVLRHRGGDLSARRRRSPNLDRRQYHGRDRIQYE